MNENVSMLLLHGFIGATIFPYPIWLGINYIDKTAQFGKV